jgi:hypothetical protein
VLQAFDVPGQIGLILLRERLRCLPGGKESSRSRISPRQRTSVIGLDYPSTAAEARA